VPRAQNSLSRYAQGEAPVKGCSRTGKSCARWVPSCLISILRKWTIRKSPVLSRLYIANVAQLIVLALYFGLNIGLMLGGAHNDISWVAHHAARLACANLPLVIGLASKNNFVSYATGLSCQSLNVFHRWSARMVFLLSLVHVGGRIHIAEPSVSTSGAGQGYIRWGIVALVGFAWMTFASARYLRNLAYSIFITGHVLVLLVLFTATWIHRPQMKGWILAGLGVYLIDRSWRFARVVKYLYVAYVPKDITRAFVAVLAEDTIRVTVRTKAQWVPGQHVYLHCPSLSLGGVRIYRCERRVID
jgi:ferric-chelate reductase